MIHGEELIKPTGGTFTLGGILANGQTFTTTAIASDAPASTIKKAIDVARRQPNQHGANSMTPGEKLIDELTNAAFDVGRYAGNVGIDRSFEYYAARDQARNVLVKYMKAIEPINRVEARLQNTGELIGITRLQAEHDSLSVTFDRPVHSDEGPIVITYHLTDDTASTRFPK